MCNEAGCTRHVLVSRMCVWCVCVCVCVCVYVCSVCLVCGCEYVRLVEVTGYCISVLLPHSRLLHGQRTKESHVPQSDELFAN
jgi:hypothetical protein